MSKAFARTFLRFLHLQPNNGDEERQLYPMNENSRYPLSSSVSTPRYISVSLISQSRSNLVAPFHQRCPGKRGIINDPASRSGLLPVSFKLKQFEPPPSTFAGGSSQSKGQTWFNLINSRRNRRLVLITVDYRPVYTYTCNQLSIFRPMKRYTPVK